MACFSSNEKAAKGSFVADAETRGVGFAASKFASGEGGEVGAVTLAGVVDGEVEGAEVGEEGLDLGDYGADRIDGVALMDKVAVGGADCEGVSVKCSLTGELESVRSVQLCDVLNAQKSRGFQSLEQDTRTSGTYSPSAYQ